MDSRCTNNEETKVQAAMDWEREVKPFLDRHKAPGWIMNKLFCDFIGWDHSSYVETICDLTFRAMSRPVSKKLD